MLNPYRDGSRKFPEDYTFVQRDTREQTRTRGDPQPHGLGCRPLMGNSLPAHERGQIKQFGQLR